MVVSLVALFCPVTSVCDVYSLPCLLYTVSVSVTSLYLELLGSPGYL